MPFAPTDTLAPPSNLTGLPGGQTLSLQSAARSPVDAVPPSRTRLSLTRSSGSSREVNLRGSDRQEQRPVQTQSPPTRAPLTAESVTPNTGSQHRQVQAVYVPNVMGLFYFTLMQNQRCYYHTETNILQGHEKVVWDMQDVMDNWMVGSSPLNVTHHR